MDPTDHADLPTDRSTVNVHTGDVSGRLLQVGTIEGDVHVHAERPAGAVAMVTRVPAYDPRHPELFVGRHEQVEDLLRGLDPAPTTASVRSLHGMGGIGKTALARRVAAISVQRNWFPGGAVQIDLHGYDPVNSQVLSEHMFAPLLRILGNPGEPIPPTVAEQATEYHRLLDTRTQQGKRVLLVLDNAADADHVRSLLPQGTIHRVLITSREYLDVSSAAPLELGVMTEPEALELLRAGLISRQPSDERITGEPAAAGEVIGWCGRLPLAIRIAAGVLANDPSLTITELAAELRDVTLRLDVLKDGTGGVHATLVTSWTRLLASDPPAARLLCLLTVNPGPDWSVETAAAIAGLEVPAARVRLRVLRRAHLLEFESGRWRFHDLVRVDVEQYAIPELRAAADTVRVTNADLSAATERLLAHYEAVTQAADQRVRALPGQQVLDGFASREEALAWLDTEQANLVAAVALAADTHRHRTTVDLAASLANLLDWRAQFADGVTVAQLARRAASVLDDPPRNAAAWNYLGLALWRVRRFENAITAFINARDIHRITGDRRGEGQALHNLGLIFRELRRFEEAISAHAQDLEICQAIGDRQGEGQSLNSLGAALREMHRFDEAITAHTRARAIHRDIGDGHGEGQALNNLGSTLQMAGRFEDAIGPHTDAAALMVATEDRLGHGIALYSLGAALHRVGRFEEAIEACTQSRDICREIGDRHGEGQALNNLGAALRAVRRPGEAISALTDAVSRFRQTGDRHDEGVTLVNLGSAWEDLGRIDDARRTWNAALSALVDSGDEQAAELVRGWLASLG